MLRLYTTHINKPHAIFSIYQSTQHTSLACESISTHFICNVHNQSKRQVILHDQSNHSSSLTLPGSTRHSCCLSFMHAPTGFACMHFLGKGCACISFIHLHLPIRWHTTHTKFQVQASVVPAVPWFPLKLHRDLPQMNEFWLADGLSFDLFRPLANWLPFAERNRCSTLVWPVETLWRRERCYTRLAVVG